MKIRMSCRFVLMPLSVRTVLLVLFSLPASPVRCEPARDPLEPSPIGELLLDAQRVEALFFMTLPSAVDGDRIHIEIPPLASRFVTTREGSPSTSEDIPLEVVYRAGPRSITGTGSWRPRSRSHHSQVTLGIRDHLISAPRGTLLLLGRHKPDRLSDTTRLECHLFASSGEEFRQAVMVLKHFGLNPDDHRPGLFGIDSEWTPKRPAADPKRLQQFLKKFDEVTAKGFTPALRRGSTGIGFTLETLLGIKENNSPQGDFLGIELKSQRGGSFRSSSSKKMNLFLKEPRWLDGLSHKERIPKYGYVDDNGRTALYSTATSRENSHGLKLTPARRELLLSFRGDPVASWPYETLEGRLQEKLRETVFVGARTRETGDREEFHFQTVLYCREPSARRLADLISTGEGMVELRMHIKETGAARNHGTAFRIRQHSLPQLYRMIVLCRPARGLSP